MSDWSKAVTWRWDGGGGAGAMCTDYHAPSGAMSIAPISIAPINAWSATGANGAGGAQELLAGEMSSPRRAFMFCAKENGKH